MRGRGRGEGIVVGNLSWKDLGLGVRDIGVGLGVHIIIAVASRSSQQSQQQQQQQQQQLSQQSAAVAAAAVAAISSTQQQQRHSWTRHSRTVSVHLVSLFFFKKKISVIPSTLQIHLSFGFNILHIFSLPFF